MRAMCTKASRYNLRRNPLENRVIVPTSGQKSHHALRAKLWCRKAFWYGFETKAFSSRQKKSGNTEKKN